MLGLSIYSPYDSDARPREPVDWPDAMRHASEEAGGVSGAYATRPFGFCPLGPETDDLLAGIRPLGAGPGVWVLVTVRGAGELGHRTHLLERCLTAAQRFILSLACDGIDSRWVSDGMPSATTFREAGVDLRHGAPVGLVWCEPGG